MFTRTKVLSLVPLFGASRRVGHAGTSVECFGLGLWLTLLYYPIQLGCQAVVYRELTSDLQS